MTAYQEKRRKSVSKIIADMEKENDKSQKLFLEKRGRVEQDIFIDITHFKVLLYIIFKEPKKESYPMQIVKDLFKIPEGTNITKTSEYQKVLRFINRWEAAKIIKKSTGKKKSVSYYIVDYNEVIKHFLSLLDVKSRGWLLEDIKKIQYKNNEYIIAPIKLYFYFLALEFYNFREFNFNSALINFQRYLFEEIEEQYKASSNFQIDIDDLENVKGIDKYGLEVHKHEDGGSSILIKDSFDMKKLPSSILDKVRKQKIQGFINAKETDIIFNLRPETLPSDPGAGYKVNEGIKKYHKKDKKLYNFFLFLDTLSKFYYEKDIPKNRCKLVIPEILDFIRAKYDPSSYEKEDKIQQSWLSKSKDLEKGLDKIDKFHFNY